MHSAYISNHPGSIAAASFGQSVALLTTNFVAAENSCGSVPITSESPSQYLHTPPAR